MPPQFKFKNQFNEHFLAILFFKRSLSPKNWRGGGKLLLLKSGIIDGYAY